MFESFAYEPRTLQATEARLKAIMEAASLGLKGEALATAAGMTLVEYTRLCQFDPIVEYAEQKARAEDELEMSKILRTAARNGDAKIALDILKHQHGWVAKQQVSVDVEQRISITAALESAQSRVINGLEHQQAEVVEYTEVKKPTHTEQKAA